MAAPAATMNLDAGKPAMGRPWYWRVARIMLLTNLVTATITCVTGYAAHRWATSSDERLQKAIAFGVQYVLTPASLVEDHGFKPEQVEPFARLIEKIVVDGPGFAPRSDGHAYWQARLLMAMPAVYKRLGRNEERIERGQRAIRLFQDLVARNPTHTDYRRRLAVTYNLHADELADLGRHADAIGQRNKATVAAERLLQHEPGHWRWRWYVAVAELGIGESLIALGESHLAEPRIATARSIGRDLCRERPSDTILCGFSERADRAGTGEKPTP